MIVLLIWAGIALYLLMVDRKISKLELFLKDKETDTHEKLVKLLVISNHKLKILIYNNDSNYL